MNAEKENISSFGLFPSFKNSRHDKHAISRFLYAHFVKGYGSLNFSTIHFPVKYYL